MIMERLITLKAQPTGRGSRSASRRPCRRFHEGTETGFADGRRLLLRLLPQASTAAPAAGFYCGSCAKARVFRSVKPALLSEKSSRPAPLIARSIAQVLY